MQRYNIVKSTFGLVKTYGDLRKKFFFVKNDFLKSRYFSRENLKDFN